MDNDTRINNSAVISIVLGAVTLVLPLLGIVTGILGIVYYTKANKEIPLQGETGNGIAITGLTLSIVGLVFQVIIILFFFLFFGLMLVDAMTY